ncbi:hypothetical protein MRB53_022942 [Persea americana]|uniref:Uncharacterized protein n=1 Tax=Persea americana TaxID=3435 RepID=A0ACC2L814_PERAE|nr:hypothetical protein MRB53_022942 [Persea americana]
MAEGAVSVFLQKLSELIEKEAHLLFGVKSGVKLLREKLEWISLSLEEADNKCTKDKEIKLWVAQVRAAAFEAEDTIDQFVYNVKNNRINRWIRLHKIGKKIQKIHLRLDKISENRLNLAIGNVQDKGEPSVPIIRKEKRSPSVEEVDIVGQWIMGDFDKLASLRTLGLDGNLSIYQAPLSSFIGKQENLKSLSLSSSPQMPTQIISSRLHELEKLSLDGRLERLPTLQEVAPSLTKLVLKDSGLLEDSMAVLEKLPKLLFLN